MTIEEKAKEYCPDDAYPFGPDIINKEVRKAFIAGWKAKEESEKPVPADLEEAELKYAGSSGNPPANQEEERMVYDAFIAGYNLCKEQTEKRWLEDRDGCFWDGVEEGKKAMKEQMLKKAVEGEVMDFSSNKPRPQVDVYVDPNKYCTGDKVRIIVLPKED